MDNYCDVSNFNLLSIKTTFIFSFWIYINRKHKSLKCNKINDMSKIDAKNNEKRTKKLSGEKLSAAYSLLQNQGTFPESFRKQSLLRLFNIFPLQDTTFSEVLTIYWVVFVCMLQTSRCSYCVACLSCCCLLLYLKLIQFAFYFVQ